MDISGIMNSDMRSFISKNQQQDNVISSFQAVLDKAAEDRNAVEDKVLREACESFESYFLQMMFREMRKTSFEDRDGMFAKSNAEKIFIDMLDEETAKSAAKTGGIGLAEMMYKQMSRQYDNV